MGKMWGEAAIIYASDSKPSWKAIVIDNVSELKVASFKFDNFFLAFDRSFVLISHFEEQIMLQIYGVIGSDGTILSPAEPNFSVIHQSPGVFVISFLTIFAKVPAIIGSQNQFNQMGQDPRDNVVFPFVSTTAATAITGDSSGNHLDRTFSFIAIGDEAI